MADSPDFELIFGCPSETCESYLGSIAVLSGSGPAGYLKPSTSALLSGWTTLRRPKLGARPFQLGVATSIRHFEIGMATQSSCRQGAAPTCG